jgi:hypothetical protein
MMSHGTTRAPQPLFIIEEKLGGGLLAIPTVANKAGGHAGHDRVLWNILRDDCPGANNRMSPDSHARQKARVHPDVSAKPNHYGLDHKICPDDWLADRRPSVGRP